MSSSDGLKDAPSQPATLLGRAQGIVGAGLILIMLYLYGIPHALWIQFMQPNPLNWLNPKRWRDLVVEGGLPRLLKDGDRDAGHLKRAAITKYADGKVLELGAGTGLSLKYYNKSAVTELCLVEPFQSLHAELKGNIEKMGGGFKQKTTIIPYGIEQRDRLKVYGIEAGTFDTIVLVQVLCSIPNREDHLPFLQSLLKPGGQLLLMEHVASEDRFTELLQNVYNPVWTTLSGGCNVNRHSGNMVRDLGGWKEVSIRVPEVQHMGSLYPRVVARFVKA